ncbi:MAG: hypothetical protein R2684_12545 [Pyrinomonadaceae bacterium]
MSGHNTVEIDPNQPYQSNVVEFKGIILFGAGLFLLIVVTFGLMAYLQYYVFEPEWAASDKANTLPVASKGDAKLPPEPRLQSAPGFGVDSKDGRVNLERREPQAEYRELMKQWQELWEKGETDAASKTVIALPMAKAKEEVLKNGSVKSVEGPTGDAAMKDASMVVSASSAGRLASEKKR